MDKAKAADLIAKVFIAAIEFGLVFWLVQGNFWLKWLLASVGAVAVQPGPSALYPVLRYVDQLHDFS